MSIEYFKDETKSLIVQKHQLLNTNNTISEVDDILSTLQKEQKNNDESLENMMATMEGLIKDITVEVSDYDINVNLNEIESEFNKIENNSNIPFVSKVDNIEIKDNLNWDEYLNCLEKYAKKNDLDLDLEYEKMFAFENVELVQINSGQEPSIICIDGFLTHDNAKLADEWLSNLPEEYKKHNIYYCKWESQKFLDIVKTVFMPTFEKLLGRFPFLIPTALYNIINIWKLAGDNATKAGKSLAGIIHSQDKKFILVGHSLGARVINSLLANISAKSKCNITNVYLLGGAINNNNDVWDDLVKKISGTIYNYSSQKDQVLQILYTIGEASRLKFDKPIGRNKINNSSIKNIDVTSYIDGHSKYHRNLRVILEGRK